MCGGVRDFGEKAGRKKGEGFARKAHFKKHFGKVTVCEKRQHLRSVGLAYTTYAVYKAYKFNYLIDMLADGPTHTRSRRRRTHITMPAKTTLPAQRGALWQG